MLNLLATLLFIATVSADVVDLQSNTFDQYVGGDKPALVEFFAPWCGHCKNLAPEWKIAGETFQPGDNIVIAAVDATENQDLAQTYGVQGYPTIKYFPAGKLLYVIVTVRDSSSLTPPLAFSSLFIQYACGK